MGDVIVIQFVTVDGIISDPDGRGGTSYGGWAFRYGAGPVDGDKFQLGDRMEKGVQLYGRRTWEQFAQLWPKRDTDYAKLMNAASKRVATSTGIDASAWSNSAAIDGDPLAWVKEESRDIVVIGSTSIVHALAEADLVDEYRLITFPFAAGEGDRLFAAGIPVNLEFTQVEAVGPATLTILRREKAARK